MKPLSDNLRLPINRLSSPTLKIPKSASAAPKKKTCMSLWAFQEKLDKLGHFYTVYKNIDELKYKFNQQLDKMAAKDLSSLNLNVMHPISPKPTPVRAIA